MEMERSIDEQIPKKGRHRKKHVYNAIMQQMEFYFSDSNLSKDRFLGQLIQNDPFVDISVFLNFNKIRKLTTSIKDIRKAIEMSNVLKLSEDNNKVKRCTPIKVRENVEAYTIYVERITADATHDWLTSVFSEFGQVVYVSLPKYKHNNLNKGFAFIEYDKESEAKQALDYFESIGCKMSSQISPEELCSIATFERDISSEQPQKNIESNCTDEKASNKRKCSSDDETETKRLKTNSGNVEISIESEDVEDKKKKKSKKLKKKVNLEELGLQVLSKLEWKKMRNRYLDMQKKKMKQLKQVLNRKRFSNRNDEKQKAYTEHEANQNATQENFENSDDTKYKFIPGVIVKLELLKPCEDLKKAKNDLKALSNDIQYIDFPFPIGSSEVFIRFSNNESAKKFCEVDVKGKCSLLNGEDEKNYWEKLQNDRRTKFNKDNKKQRGRDRLLKKAEKELGKHIKFGDSD